MPASPGTPASALSAAELDGSGTASADERTRGARAVDGLLLARGRSDADADGSADALAIGVTVKRGSSSWRNAVCTSSAAVTVTTDAPRTT